MKIITFLAMSMLLPLVTGCGTIVRGTTESVTISAEPQASSIRTSTGRYCPRSPCTIEVDRKEEFTAYAEHPGYKPGSVHVGTKVSGSGAAGMAGNVVAGGIIGIGVDSMTGAALDHYPNPAHIVLEPEDNGWID